MSKEAKILGIISILIVGLIVFLAIRAGQQANAPIDPAVLTRPTSHATGSHTAKVMLVEFGDYQCPACGYAAPIIEKVIEAYKTNPGVSIVFRHFPLSQHKNAQAAAEAAEAAAAQGKFWEMHAKLYANQDAWKDAADPLPLFAEYARQAGIKDIEKFKRDVTGNAFASVISADAADGRSIGVDSTPTFYLNGARVPGILSLDGFKALIDAELKK